MTWIKAILVIEVLGRPAEHVSEVLRMIGEKLENEKGVSVKNKKFFPPKQIESLFSSFVEVELEIESFHRLLEICFEYLPSSIEIIEPTELSMKLQDANAILNYLAAKLHNYESLLKILATEREVLIKQLESEGKKPELPTMKAKKALAKESKKSKKKKSSKK
jgi:hypothetical protein